MTPKMSDKQALQEGEYEFPYHYLPQWGRQHLRPGVRNLGYEYLSYLFFIRDFVVKRGFRSLLDVGCGDGRFLHELGKSHNQASQMTGIDLSERALGFARAFTRKANWVCGDISAADVLPHPYDIVTLIEVLEHIPPGDTPKFVRGIHQWVRDDGVLILSVPSTNVRVIPKHYRHFDLDSLRNTLAPHFAVSEVFWLNRTHHFTAIANVLLRMVWLPGPIGRYYFSKMLRATPKTGSRIVAVCEKRNPASLP